MVGLYGGTNNCKPVQPLSDMIGSISKMQMQVAQPRATFFPPRCTRSFLSFHSSSLHPVLLAARSEIPRKCHHKSSCNPSSLREGIWQSFTTDLVQALPRRHHHNRVFNSRAGTFVLAYSHRCSPLPSVLSFSSILLSANQLETVPKAWHSSLNSHGPNGYQSPSASHSSSSLPRSRVRLLPSKLISRY